MTEGSGWRDQDGGIRMEGGVMEGGVTASPEPFIGCVCLRGFSCSPWECPGIEGGAEEEEKVERGGEERKRRRKRKIMKGGQGSPPGLYSLSAKPSRLRPRHVLSLLWRGGRSGSWSRQSQGAAT